MTDSVGFNIREICRGCLSDNKDNLRSIFDSNISDSFIACTNVQVTDGDGLPKLICSSCVYKVVSWKTFKSQCQQSDDILRTTFQCLSEIKDKSPSIRNDQSVECLSQQNFDGCNDSENHSIESKKEVTNVAAPQSIDILNDELENRIENEQCPTNTVDNEVYEDEEFLATIDEQDIDVSDHSSVDPSITSHTKSSRSPPKKHVSCDECGVSFRNVDRLQSHQRSVHEGKKPEVCRICQKEFNNLRALRRHQLKHSDLKQFRCDECDRTYKYQTSLTLHKKSHANVRRFVCDLCGKSFVRSHGLQSHLLSHSTLTPFACDYDACGKQFKNSIMLRNHQKRHLGIKTFVCSHPDCGKEFITSAELNTHIRSHTGAKPFACSMCDKAYKTKSHLTVHYRSHSGSRPYACDVCHLKFAHNKVLKQHRLVHLGEMPHICDVCQRPFRQRSTLMKHKKLHMDGKLRKNQQQTQPDEEPLTYTESIQLKIELQNLEK